MSITRRRMDKDLLTHRLLWIVFHGTHRHSLVLTASLRKKQKRRPTAAYRPRLHRPRLRLLPLPPLPPLPRLPRLPPLPRLPRLSRLPRLLKLQIILSLLFLLRTF